MATTRPNSSGDVKKTPYAAGGLFRNSALSIGRRLTVCFLLVVVSMIAAGAVVFWQFRQMVVPSQHLSNADQTSLALTRLNLDVDTFRENLAALESDHDTKRFSTEAAELRQNFLRNVEDALQALSKGPEIAREDPTIPAALETLKVTLASQLDSAVQLAATGDWNAVRLRLEYQIHDLINLSSSLVAKVDAQARQQRSKAIEDAETARHRLFVVLLISGLLTLILAATLGWYATQSITVPLSELASGAHALARGDLSHEVSIYGNDELAIVGRAFNHAVRQLQELYEELREQASLLSLTHDAIYVRDMKGVIRYWNRGAEELYAWPAEHALGKVAHELLKAVPPLPFEQIQTELLRDGHWEGELVKSRKNGTQMVVASRWSLKRDERGEPAAILVTSNDISDRKRAEEALRRLNRELRAISNCNQSLLRATDEQSLLEEICRIVREEAGYGMAWVGYAEHDEAKSVRTVAWSGAEAEYLARAGLTWADTERGDGPTGTAIRSGKRCCIQDFASDPRLAPWRESLLQRGFRSAIALPLKDENDNAFGSLTIYSVQANAFGSEEIRLLEELAGDLAFGIVTLRSGAARKRAEEALRRSEAYLAEAQRLSHTGSWAFSPATTKTHYWSDETFRIWGFDPQDGPPTQEQLFERIHPEDRDTVKTITNKALREKTDLDYEFRIVLPDETVKHIHTTVHVVLDGSGDTVEFIGTNVDVTEPKRAKEALRESEATLKRAQEIAHIGSWHLDVTRNQLTWSDETYRIFGVTPGATPLSYEDFLNKVHPEDRERVDRAWAAGMQGAPYDIEHRILIGDEFKWVRENAEVEFDPQGNAVKGIGTVQDITERKRSEEEVRNTAEQWQATFDAVQDLILLLDEDFRILRANHAVTRFLGLPFDKIVGGHCYDLIHETSTSPAECPLAKMRQSRKHEEAEVLARKGGPWLSVSVDPLVDPSGEVRQVVHVARDITERKRAEEERCRSAERFRAIADYTYDWENWIGVDGKLLWVNPAVERLTGYSVDECMAMPEFPVPIVAEADRQAVALQMRGAVEGSSGNDFEFRVRRKDGRLAWVAASWQPIHDSQGARLGHRSSMRDIAARKRAEETLQQSEDYLAEAQRLSHTGSFAFDVASNKYVYISEECLRIFELDAQESLPVREAVSRLIHREDWERAQGDFDNLLREKVDIPSEFRIVLPSGALKHIRVIRHPVLNEEGEVSTVVGTAMDITERKRAEQELRDSETRFRTFIDHASDALFVQDLEEEVIVDVNRSACESLGYTRQELIGKTPLGFHLDSDRAEIEALMGRASAGESVSDRHWHRRKDGSKFPVEARTTLVSYDGRRFLLKVARDISDRVRAEEQREELRQLEAELAHLDRLTMLGELTASIAHEVNQPLSGVVSNGSACLRWLAGDVPNLEEARDAARRIVRDGKRAGEVIARIRALTKKAPTPREKLDLNETLRQVLVLIGDQAKRNSVIIRTQFADDLSPVSGDQVQLQQVVLNLAMNAIESMSSVRERPREVMISTENIDGNQVQVKVEDSGMGLDPNAMQRIFEPFYTTKPTGMGMGLSISRSILLSHGGRLWAAPKEGSGTIFYFTLPKYHEEESHAGVSAA